MKHFLDWRDYTRQPHIKQLMEQKGVEAARIKYMQELKRVQYNDPTIIAETNNAGISVPAAAAANAAAGNSTDFIIGNAGETDTFTWAVPLAGLAITGSAVDGKYFDIEGYNGNTDYTAGHVQSFKVCRCYFTTQSAFEINSGALPAGIDIVVTASSVGAAGANFTHYSSSIAYQWQEALNNQSATAIVGGITNTIAPGGIFLATTASNGATLAIQRDYTSGVNFLSSSYATTTGSISRDYAGNDTWYGNQGVQLFNGRLQPYSNYPRKSS